MPCEDFHPYDESLLPQRTDDCGITECSIHSKIIDHFQERSTMCRGSLLIKRLWRTIKKCNGDEKRKEVVEELEVAA
jgi:hypothetical protein